MSTILRWHAAELVTADLPLAEGTIVAADSWLVQDGATLGIDLHRQRFLTAVGESSDAADLNAAHFWDAALATLPRTGNWFPRVELQRTENALIFTLTLRPAPELTRSVVLATHSGHDPRRSPTIKGPDTAALLVSRQAAIARGADESVILSPDGMVVEGAYSALLWWRGDALCVPSPELARVDSVTARSIITLATALGLDVLYEAVPPGELEGLELWAVSALHGIRIVTGWIDGPAPAELPGRLSLWRTRLVRLSRQLPDVE